MSTLTNLRAAHRHEARLQYLARPGAWALFRAGAVFGPVRRFPKLGWVVSDADVARTVLTDARHFTVFEEGGSGHLWRQVLGAEVDEMFTDAGHRSTRLRTKDLFTEANSWALVESSFGPALARMRHRLAAGEEVDVAYVTRVLVGRMAADLVGLDLARTTDFAPRAGHDPQAPEDDSYQQVFDVVRDFTGLAIKTLMSTHQDEAVIAESRRLVDRLAVGMERAFRTAPDTTMLGRCREIGLSFAEARGLCVLMLVAATETGATSMTRAVALLHDTGQQHGVLASAAAHGGELPEPELADVVREVLRVTSPATVVGRHVTGDVALHGRQLHDGDRVLMLIHTANNASGPFDVTRAPGPGYQQLWFGAGRHICVGAPVARAEIAMFLRELIAVGRPWTVTGRRYSVGVINPAYRRLTVRCD
ncbi:cytochrome P450 [Spongisporangium articulatum]|uniref:Cytochrome P450 n=1 Tax=Spongisporangium articulatum TaxID=3362603 RepID=A0ABW8AMB2_9ACTN